MRDPEPGTVAGPAAESPEEPHARVLILHCGYQRRGGEDEVFDAERDLLERRGHPVASFRVDNARAQELGTLSLVSKTLWNRDTYGQVRDRIADFKPDVVHVHNTFPLMSGSVIHAIHADQIPCVTTLHNFRLFCAGGSFLRDGATCQKCVGRVVGWSGIRHACYRNSRRASAALVANNALHAVLGTWRTRIDAYLAPSRFVADQLVALGLPARRVHVKPHFLAPDPGAGTGPNAAGGGGVVFVGRLSRQKGVPTLLEAWRAGPDLPELKIVGEGELEGDVREAASSLSNVSWAGRRPLDEVLELMGRASVVVVPSLGFETFGRVVIESFARGTPVLTSGSGALGELVDDGVDGVHFRAGDARDLGERLRGFLADVEVADRFREAARRSFVERYGAEANYRRLMELYARAIAERRSRDRP